MKQDHENVIVTLIQPLPGLLSEKQKVDCTSFRMQSESCLESNLLDKEI